MDHTLHAIRGMRTAELDDMGKSHHLHFRMWLRNCNLDPSRPDVILIEANYCVVNNTASRVVTRGSAGNFRFLAAPELHTFPSIHQVARTRV
jgi:hypothetical protein